MWTNWGQVARLLPLATAVLLSGKRSSSYIDIIAISEFSSLAAILACARKSAREEVALAAFDVGPHRIPFGLFNIYLPCTYNEV